MTSSKIVLNNSEAWRRVYKKNRSLDASQRKSYFKPELVKTKDKRVFIPYLKDLDKHFLKSPLIKPTKETLLNEYYGKDYAKKSNEYDRAKALRQQLHKNRVPSAKNGLIYRKH